MVSNSISSQRDAATDQSDEPLPSSPIGRNTPNESMAQATRRLNYDYFIDTKKNKDKKKARKPLQEIEIAQAWNSSVKQARQPHPSLNTKTKSTEAPPRPTRPQSIPSHPTPMVCSTAHGAKESTSIASPPRNGTNPAEPPNVKRDR